MNAYKLMVSLILLSASASVSAADLSPGKWPAQERARLEQMEQALWPSTTRAVEGRSGFIAATLSPIATHVGMQALRSGGTAADAAIATALTQVATDLGSIVSYAGVLQLVYYDAKTGDISSLDAGWNSYLGEHDPMSIPSADVRFILPDRPVASVAPVAQGRKTLVPGFMAGIEAIHKRFGKLPFDELFRPAIWYSTQGVKITPLLRYFLSMQRETLARTEEGRRFLHQAGNDMPNVGDRFIQADLARLLAAVASHGAAVMYTGEWGRAYVEAVRREGGQVTAEDLRRYAPMWEKPLSTKFGQSTVFGPGEHGAQGWTILEMLNLLDALKFTELGPYWEDSRAFAAYARTLQFATVGHYSPQVPAFEREHGFASTPAERLTPRYAQTIVPAIAELSGYGKPAAEGHHSAAVVAVDRWGNVAALVHSINSSILGDTGIVVQGIPLSGAGGIYQYRLAAIKPGERLPGDPAPVIVTRNGKPVLAVAAVGVSLVPDTVRMVATAPRNADDLQRVLAAPPLLLNLETPQDTLAPRAVVIPQGSYGHAMLEELGKVGIQVKEIAPDRVTAIKGTSAVAILDGESGLIQTAERPGVVVFADADR
jgi:gamma-glutamyltranspeptidase / glutathione hydrolase